MLKITVQEEAEAVTLKIEGVVVGPNVPELQRAWQELVPSLGSRKLLVDLCDVTFMDSAARSILADISRKLGAEFLADTPMTKYFAQEAKRAVRATTR